MHEISDMIQSYSLHMNKDILEACQEIRPQHVISLPELQWLCLQGGMLHRPVVVLCC